MALIVTGKSSITERVLPQGGKGWEKNLIGKEGGRPPPEPRPSYAGQKVWSLRNPPRRFNPYRNLFRQRRNTQELVASQIQQTLALRKIGLGVAEEYVVIRIVWLNECLGGRA